MNFQFSPTSNFQSSNNFVKAKDRQSSAATDFSIELDRISSFQELYNSINKLKLKPDWTFTKNDNEVVIYKVKSVPVEIPKLSVIIKVTTDLDIHVWVEEVALDVKSSIWKLLGYNFVEDEITLRYSMLLDLIRFLDVNQLLVTDRRQKWQLNSAEVLKVLKGTDRYCTICFKTVHGKQAIEIDTDTVNFLTEVIQRDFLLDRTVCQPCLTYIDELKIFRSHLFQAHSLLEATLKGDTNVNEIQSNEGEQLVLIRAQHDITDDFVAQPQLKDDVASLKTDSTYDEEWLLEEENNEEAIVEVFEELTETINHEIYQEMDNYEEITCTESLFEEIESNSSKTVKHIMPSSGKLRRTAGIKTIVQTPNNQGLFECPECDKTYLTGPAVNKHLYRVHSPATEKCPVCSKMYNRYKLQCHMHFHKLRHKCQICDKSFPHPSNLMIHMKKKHLNHPITHPCPLCHLDLATNQLLRSHLLEEHDTLTFPKDNGNKKPVECDYCGKQYKSKSSIANHFRRGCDQNPRSIKTETLQCRVCNLEVESSSKLTSHMKNHTTRYVCEFCKTKFTHKAHYQRHMEKHKNQSRPYQCDHCGASYSRIEHVKAHIARTHTKNFKRKCQYCKKGFISINELRDHERVHTNERPFVCTFSGCQNTFRTKSALRNHLIRHTNYYYPCKYCLKKFRNINNIVNHCKKLHQNEYKSDDELDFIPVLLTSTNNDPLEEHRIEKL